MTTRRHLIVALIVLSTFAALLGCGHTAPATDDRPAAAAGSSPGEQRQQIEDLTRALLALDPGVGENEARQVAQSAYTHVEVLTRRYRVVRPPELHNLLVRLGWKPRGLCYHWTEDLINHLETLDLRQLRLERVVANRGSDLHEHHSLIVTTRENRFSQGIVLDGWRNSGVLYWGPVGEDRFPWVPLHGADLPEEGANGR